MRNNGGGLAYVRQRGLLLQQGNYPLPVPNLTAGYVVDTTGADAAALVAIHNDGIPTHAGRGCGASGCLDWSPHARRSPDSRRVQAENAPATAVFL